jgi:hypothetical protein
MIAASVIGLVLGMLTTVEFNNQPSLKAHKIADVETDLVLPSELESCELAAAEPSPEYAFRVCRVCSQASGVLAHARSCKENSGESLTTSATNACIRMTPPPLRGASPSEWGGEGKAKTQTGIALFS